MKVLILGAYGFLGMHLSRHLESEGFYVIKLGRSCSADIKYVHQHDSSRLPSILEKIKPDIIINLIALTNVDLCEKQPRLAYELNTDLPSLLTSALLTINKQPQVIHVSTDQVYDGKGPHSELSNVKPANTYSLTKLFGEFKIESNHTLILRTNFVGRSLVASKSSFSDWIINSLNSSTEIRGFNDIFFTPLHISSLCHFITIAIKSRITGLYNLGCSSGIDKGSFMLKLCDALQLNKGLITLGPETSGFNNQRARRPKDMRLDSTKFRETTNVVLPSIDNEICKLANEYRERKIY